MLTITTGKNNTKDKQGYFIIRKESVYQEDIILNVYRANNRVKIKIHKRVNRKIQIIVRNISTLFSIIDRTRR